MLKRLVIVIFIMFGAFLSFSLYRTFAYDTSVVEETPSTTDLEYTFKIGNSSIKQITVDSGETRYYDIVLGNPNNAKISYSVYYEMVSPSYEPDGFVIWYTTKSTGKSTGKVDKDGNITLNIEVTNTSDSAVTFKIGSVAGYVNGGELILGSEQTLIPNNNASLYIKSLCDYTHGDNGSGVRKVSGGGIRGDESATGSNIKSSIDYRYYGPNPNNYICLDMEGRSTCPDKYLYRIIGSIYEENAGAQLIKIIKATLFSNNSTTSFAWNNEGTNIWATPTSGRLSINTSSGSSLMKILNNDFLNTSNSYALNNIVQGYINKSLFYLGGENTSEMTPDFIYIDERRTKVYGTDNSRPLTWIGKVGLMYPSDYGYAAGRLCSGETNLYNYDRECYKKNWLFVGMNEWLMMPYSDNSSNASALSYGGAVDFTDTTDTFSVRPTFYLDKDVVITSGTGTESDPYQITK